MAEEQRQNDPSSVRVPRPTGSKERLIGFFLAFLPFAVFACLTIGNPYVLRDSPLLILPLCGLPIAFVVFIWSGFSKRTGAMSVAGMSFIGAVLGIVGFYAMPIVLVDDLHPWDRMTKDNLRAIEKSLDAYAKITTGYIPMTHPRLFRSAILDSFPEIHGQKSR